MVHRRGFGLALRRASLSNIRVSAASRRRDRRMPSPMTGVRAGIRSVSLPRGRPLRLQFGERRGGEPVARGILSSKKLKRNRSNAADAMMIPWSRPVFDVHGAPKSLERDEI